VHHGDQRHPGDRPREQNRQRDHGAVDDEPCRYVAGGRALVPGRQEPGPGEEEQPDHQERAVEGPGEPVLRRHEPGEQEQAEAHQHDGDRETETGDQEGDAVDRFGGVRPPPGGQQGRADPEEDHGGDGDARREQGEARPHGRRPVTGGAEQRDSGDDRRKQTNRHYRAIKA
jgi:hypothetical protein